MGPDAAPAEGALIRALEGHAERRPDALAVRDIDEAGSERCFSWAELRNAARQVGLRLGGGERRVVVTAMGNRFELLASLLGALWADAAVLPLPPELPRSRLREAVRRSGAAIAIGEAGPLEALSACVETKVCVDQIRSSEAADPGRSPGDGNGVLLLHSSGTTGDPKIACRGAAALYAVGNGSRAAIGASESDLLLLTIPLYHSYGIDQVLLMSVAAGCAVEFHARFDPARVRTALIRREITLLPGTPFLFDALARTAPRPVRLPSLRCAYSAGSPLSQAVSERFEKAFGVRLGQIYGATEFGSITFNDPRELDFDPTSCGRPMRGVEIRILDRESARRRGALAVGSEGEVAVLSPTLLERYLDESVDVGDDGFLTGDIGRVDSQGRLSLKGRFKLLVDVGGMKVNPLEVETILERHPGVREVAVVAVPHTDLGCRLKAVVVPEVGFPLTTHDLRAFAREHLIYYQVPRRFELCRSLPRSPTGKLLRAQLDPSFSGSSGRDGSNSERARSLSGEEA